jgi:hypothetical protein
MPFENAELNRQTRVFRNAVTDRKQRVATRPNRQKLRFSKTNNLRTTSVTVSALCAAFRPFLTGSGSQTEFAVTHSKQSTGEFLTGARTAIKVFTIRQLRRPKLARVNLRNRYDVRGFNTSLPGLPRAVFAKGSVCLDTFLPGSAQQVEIAVTHSKQTTATFLPGSRFASWAHTNSSNIDSKLSEESAWLRL